MTAGLDSELREVDIQSITDEAYKKGSQILTETGFPIISYVEAKKIMNIKKELIRMLAASLLI